MSDTKYTIGLELNDSKINSTLSEIDRKLGNLISEFKKGAEFKVDADASKGAETVKRQMSDAGKQSGISFGTLFKSQLLADLASSGIQAAVSGIFSGVKGGFGLAADFEAQMSSIKALSGLAAEDMERVKNVALEAGKATKFSGLEAAQGLEELIKAGLSTENALAGLEGALNLAAAGEISVADAAEIASTALNAFKKDGMSVADAADILAGAANASATDVGELKFALSAAGSVASAVGLSFEDTNTALAVLAQNGLKGSDAGTSLKTMLMNLQPGTKEQSALFKELGLATMDVEKGMANLEKEGFGSLDQYVTNTTDAKFGTKEFGDEVEKAAWKMGFYDNAFFDANGTIEELPKIAGALKNALKDMTDQQRLSALETLFGSDAIRAANILYSEGETGINKMSAAMKNFTAAEVAQERINNFKGALDELMGTIETLTIEGFTPLLELATPGVKVLTDLLNSIDSQAAVAQIQNITTSFGDLTRLLATGQFSEGMFGGMSADSGFVTAIQGIREAFFSLGESFAKMQPLAQPLLNLFGTLGQYMVGNLSNGIQIFAAAFETVRMIMQPMAEFILPMINSAFSFLANTVLPTLQPILAPLGTVLGAIFAVLAPAQGIIMAVAGAAGWFSSTWIALGAALGGTTTTIGLVASGIALLSNPITWVVAAVAGLSWAWNENFLGIRDLTMPILEGIQSGFQFILDGLAAFQQGVSIETIQAQRALKTTEDAATQMQVKHAEEMVAMTERHKEQMALLPTMTEEEAAKMRDNMDEEMARMTFKHGAEMGSMSAKHLEESNKLVEIQGSTTNKLRENWDSFWSQTKTILDNSWATIKAVWDAATQSLQAIWEGVWNTIKAFLSAVFLTIVALLKNEDDKIREIWSSFGEKLKEIWNKVWEGIKEAFSNAIKALLKKFGGFEGSAGEAMERVKTKIETLWTEAVNFLTSMDLEQVGRDAIQGFIDGITSMAGNLWDSMKSVARSAVTAAEQELVVKSPSRKFFEIGEYTIEGQILGSLSKAGELVNTMQSIAGASVGAFAQTVGNAGSQINYDSFKGNLMSTVDREIKAAQAVAENLVGKEAETESGGQSGGKSQRTGANIADNRLTQNFRKTGLGQKAVDMGLLGAEETGPDPRQAMRDERAKIAKLGQIEDYKRKVAQTSGIAKAAAEMLLEFEQSSYKVLYESNLTKEKQGEILTKMAMEYNKQSDKLKVAAGFKATDKFGISELMDASGPRFKNRPPLEGGSGGTSNPFSSFSGSGKTINDYIGTSSKSSGGFSGFSSSDTSNLGKNVADVIAEGIVENSDTIYRAVYTAVEQGAGRVPTAQSFSTAPMAPSSSVTTNRTLNIGQVNNNSVGQADSFDKMVNNLL